MGKRGGAKGGHARAEKMTSEQRSEAARKAVQGRGGLKQGRNKGGGCRLSGGCNFQSVPDGIFIQRSSGNSITTSAQRHKRAFASPLHISERPCTTTFLHSLYCFFDCKSVVLNPNLSADPIEFDPGRRTLIATGAGRPLLFRVGHKIEPVLGIGPGNNNAIGHLEPVSCPSAHEAAKLIPERLLGDCRDVPNQLRHCQP